MNERHERENAASVRSIQMYLTGVRVTQEIRKHLNSRTALQSI